MGKFYAVFHGRKPGVYTSWNECQEQIKGFKGCVYKSFALRSEAEEFAQKGKLGLRTSVSGVERSRTVICSASKGSDEVIDEATLLEVFGDMDDDEFDDEKITINGKGNRKRKMDTGKNKECEQARKVARKTAQKNGVFFNLDGNGNAVVYTDGACSNNGKKKKLIRAGYGVWWGDGHPLNLSRRLEGVQTNQRAEIAAINACLKQAIENKLKAITVKTDSMFVINCMTKWVFAWVRNNWVKSDGKPVIHKDEFLEMLENLKKVKVTWEHVRGHKGIYGNEMADKLAVGGSLL